MNKERLLAVRNRMVAHRERFRYDFICQVRTGSKQWFATHDIYTKESSNDHSSAIEQMRNCGTLCCIAGFAIEEKIFNQPLTLETHENFNTAKQYLGLTAHEAEFLFTPSKSEITAFARAYSGIGWFQPTNEEKYSIEYLLKYPRLNSISYHDLDDNFKEALSRIDYLLEKP